MSLHKIIARIASVQRHLNIASKRFGFIFQHSVLRFTISELELGAKKTLSKWSRETFKDRKP